MFRAAYPLSPMLALVALGAAAQHEARRRRHQEAAATHGAAAELSSDDHELWLRSSGAVNAYADPYVPEPPYCTYRLHIPGGTGQLLRHGTY